MANIVSLHNAAKEYAGRTLFSGLSLGIEEGHHIGLIGPNGAGKSTLMKILMGEVEADAGTVARRSGLRVSYLSQVPDFVAGDTIVGAIARDLTKISDDWERQMKALEYLSFLSLDEEGYSPETPLSELSGGWKKKVAIARELAKEPDLFLLDEPTNHLDVESIAWLEKFLNEAAFAFIVITHDRAFLQNVTRRILELDRRNAGGILSVEGSYADYLELKQGQSAAQMASEESLRNKLRRETEWLRRGPQARTTKQQARIERAYDLMEDVAEIREKNRDRRVNLDFRAAEGGPKKLIEARGVAKTFGGRTIFSDLDLLITRSSRIGLLGKNGAGKSTLIRTLTGEMSPDQGSVKFADNLKIAYFEQNRQSLDPEMTLRQAVCPAGDYVKLRERHIHINSYLERFLFRPEQAQSPIRKLSGGEQSRILMAQLMLQEANLLVLDEPTNDLDVATLDLLQEQLENFEGAILLVTHDRYFLDQVCDQILYLHAGVITEFYGLAQWESARRQAGGSRTALSSGRTEGTTRAAAPVATAGAKRRLSYKEQREFDGMEAEIQAREHELGALSLESAQASVLLSRRQEIFSRMAELQTQIEGLYERWVELEARRG